MNLKRIFAGLCLLAATASAHADIIIDQSYTGESNSGALTSSGDFRRAQTFTVGVAGFLNTVEVFIWSGAESFSNMSILDSVEGTGNIIATSSLVTNDGFSAIFNLRQYNIAVEVGDVLAFEIRGLNGITGVYKTSDSYTGGTDYFINPDYGFNSFTPNATDAFFVTTVDNGISPVPEPSHYAMLALGLMLVGGIARRRRKG